MNIVLIVIGALLLCYALWFVAETIRYLISGEYQLDQRLWRISH